MSLLPRIEKGNQRDDSDGEGPGTAVNVGALSTAIAFIALAARLRSDLHAKLDPAILDDPTPDARSTIEDLLATLLKAFLSELPEGSISLKPGEKHRLFDPLVAEILGFGPLEALWADDAISEIMVNNAQAIYVVYKGHLQRAKVSFESEAHVLKILNRMLAPMGEHVDEGHPIARVKLLDGSHIHVIVRPIAMNGPTITIRKFSRQPYTIEDLLRFGSLTVESAEFLRACVIARLNIVVIGRTGAAPGITTLLNVLATWIPDDERIIAIESIGELQLKQEHLITLVPRRPDLRGAGEVTMRDLVQNVPYLHANRILVDECQAGAAFELLQLMARGYDGTMIALHARDPRDALNTLETMSRSGTALSSRVVRETIASAVHLIIQIESIHDGSRKLTNISEIQGMDGDAITVAEVFKFVEQPDSRSRPVYGRMQSMGVRPQCLDRLEAAGYKPESFMP